MIRSVIRGRVVFRTRGSFDGEHHGRAIEQIAREHYPALCDPEWMAGHSVHMEYVSPSHRIVVPYPEPDLVLIGATANETLEMMAREEVLQLAEEHGLRPPDEVPLGGRSLEEGIAAADAEERREGFVLRFPGGMLKIKGARYKEATRRRYELHPRKLLRICERHGLRSAEELISRLRLQDEDPLASYVRDVFDDVRRWREQVASELADLEELLAANGKLSRKQLARRVAKSLGTPRGPALLKLAEGDREAARELLANHAANRIFTA